VVVWQVADTAKATYSVDEYTKFVAIQTETAVRHIASRYPYTNHDGSEQATQPIVNTGTLYQ
jgi:regulator of protease activity HflC (stomatin/prohibitin superfamily)